MARFFSGKKSNACGLFEEMKVAWGLHNIKPMQILGDNRFLIEFDTEEAKQRVVEGGPWRHERDTLIVVSYDGLAPPLSIVINSITMWVRFYDLPAALRKEDYVQKLGTRLGQVQRIDMSFLNYVRARVMFPLANALIPEVKIRIQGKGDMKVSIRYENVPYFCFIYGRIGHSDTECPNGEVADGAFNFGVGMRASPPKWLREIKMQTKSVAACFLNFEGAQRDRLQDEASLSMRSANVRATGSHG
jgi:hypothetical protein